MPAQPLADPRSLTQLEASFPVSLDTDFQNTDWYGVTDPRLFERILKLHGLLSPHLIISEAQVLDHLALRLFLLNLNASEREDLLSYLTTPLTAKGFSELAPVVLASEPYDATDLTAPFALDQLFQRKLGLDERKKPPWEMSSVDEARRTEFNRRMAREQGSSRFQFAIDNLPPRHRYREYLTFASDIWDENASVTRIPSQVDLRSTLQQHLDQLLQDQVNSKVQEAAGKLREQLSAGQITYRDGTTKGAIIRSTVRPWLRETFGPRRGSHEINLFDDLLNRSWYEAFVISLPGHRGWLGTCDPNLPGAESNRELNCPPWVMRKSVVDTVANVVSDTLEVNTGGPLMLDWLTFRKLKDLRANPEFQESLSNLHKEWWCPNPYNNGLKPALKRHFELIYKLLGAHLRSTKIRRDGPNLKITPMSIGAPFAIPAIMTAAGHLNPYHWVGAFVAVVIFQLWDWEREKKKPQRWCRDLEDRVFETSSSNSAPEKRVADRRNT
jgi:hypothetical protein